MSDSKLVTYTRKTKHYSTRKGKIQYIIPHCYVGQVTAKQGCDFFATTDRDVSANYVIGRDGSIGLSVPEQYRAWTTGGKDKNGNIIRVNGLSGADLDHMAVTIEVASDTKEPYAVTDAAMAALVKLMADICQRNGISKLLWKADKTLVGKPERQNIAVHRWFANKSCPGDYLYQRMDEIVAKVNALLTSEEKTVTLALPVLQKGSKGASVTSLQQLLTAKGFDPNGIDGSFGAGCEKAVRAYQRANGLTVDGSVGERTWSSLLIG